MSLSLSRQRRKSSNKTQPIPPETVKVAGGQVQAKPDVTPVAEEQKARPVTGYYRCHVDQFDDSPYEIPNSQAPIPGREVFWDMDTPETKRYRQSLLAQTSPLCSSPPRRRSPTPRMKLVSRRQKQVSGSMAGSQETVTAGDLAMEACLRLMAGEDESVKEEAMEEVVEEGGDMFSDEEMEHEPAGELDGNVFEETANEDFFSEGLAGAAKDSTNVKNLDFNDCEGDVFGDNDGFEDGDESLLLAASQQVNATPRAGEREVFKKEVKGEAFKLPLVNRALERLQEEDTVIFDSDDSFDDALSQMPDPSQVVESATPASPVLKKRRSPKRRSAEQLKEIFLNVTKPPPEEETVVKPKAQAAPSSFKKHSSFDQAVSVEVTGVRRENSLKRIKSSPVISQERAGKEQIEGKRKEALAKRQEAEAKRQKEEMARKIKEEQARKAKEEQERKEELARKSKEEQARKAKEELARKIKEEQARKTKEEQARKTKEEQARKTKEELARKTKEEQARKTKEVIERKRQEAMARRAASQASQQSQRPGVRN